MTATTPDIVVRHYNGRQFDAIRHIALDLYRAVFAHEIDEPFWSVERFAHRIDRHATMTGFGAVIVYAHSEPIGMAYGITLPPTTHWWATIHPPLTDPAFTHEDGHRIFALFEVIATPDYQNKGAGRRVHDELLATRNENRVTIATHHGNTHARDTYTRWGYHHIGTRQPEPPAPLMDVYVRDRTS